MAKKKFGKFQSYMLIENCHFSMVIQIPTLKCGQIWKFFSSVTKYYIYVLDPQTQNLA